MSKRIVYAPDLNSFKLFLMNKDIDVSRIEDLAFRAQVENLTAGCFVLAFKQPKLSHKVADDQTPLVEGVAMHKFSRSVNMMVSRENISSLHIRYLTHDERQSCAALFDLQDK